MHQLASSPKPWLPHPRRLAASPPRGVETPSTAAPPPCRSPAAQLSFRRPKEPRHRPELQRVPSSSPLKARFRTGARNCNDTVFGQPLLAPLKEGCLTVLGISRRCADISPHSWA